MRQRDYGADGAYYVTVCTIDRLPLFGDVIDGQLRLNAVGSVVAETWKWLAQRYAYVTLDEWCVMPDHLHGVIILGARDSTVGGPTTTVDAMATAVDTATPRRKPVGELIGAFKTVSTKEVNRMRGTPGAQIWQRNFWDHVIRDEADLSRICTYIRQQAGS